MTRDGWLVKDRPDLQVVLDALDDPACRDIISALREPLTASDLSERLDLPLSTTYRKLERLTEASLLDEDLEIRPDGRHTRRYRVDFEAVDIALNDLQEFEVSVERPARTPEDRLATLWAEVRKER
jgi:DNA-binding transcriptional ArsR family regulator